VDEHTEIEYRAEAGLRIAPYAEAPKTHAQWTALAETLAEPFAPELVDFRPGNREALAYIDARVVMDRLDAVVGPHNWTFEPVAVVQDTKEVKVALGRLTIHGVTKCDYGEASNFHATKGAASDALKRAAVHWGIGRYLYDVDGFPFSGKEIPDSVKAQLRKRLPAPRGYQPGTVAVPMYARGEGAERPAEQTTGDSGGVAQGAQGRVSQAAAGTVRPLVFKDWNAAKVAAKARGVPDKAAWDALTSRHRTLAAMGAYLATLPVKQAS
jgi:hypothetical protein